MWLRVAVEIALESIAQSPVQAARWVVSDFRRMRATVLGSVGSQARQDKVTCPPDDEIDRVLWETLRKVVQSGT